MPLYVDGNYRGPAGSHVLPHCKLGQHRTVITAALDLMDWLVDEEAVSRVELGKMATASASPFERRCEYTVRGRSVYLLLVDTTAAQAIVVRLKKDCDPDYWAEEVRKEWVKP